MSDSKKYDIIVIGAGQGGIPFAQASAANGRRTAIIERKHVGGTCINEGCTPSKTMASSARVAYLAQRAGDYGVVTGGVRVDLEAVRRRKRAIVADWRSAGEERLEATEGLDLLRGDARFIGSHSVSVAYPDGSSAQLEAPIIIIDTGTRPAVAPIPGLGAIPALDSTTVMELGAVPEHLIVLGGGYVGVEFAQMFRRFGSAVTVVQREDHLLSREDTDITEAIAGIFAEDGIEVLVAATTREVGATPEGGVYLRARTEAEGAEATITGSHLLTAIGRVPNTDTLGLDVAGIAASTRGFINVDDRLETTVPGVYAIGDVTGGPQFTHVSYDDYHILEANILRAEAASTHGRLLPYAVFIDPQLGRVGMGEREARAAGSDVQVFKMPMSHVARALEVDETRGLMKAVVDRKTDRILGAAVLGLDGGEITGMLQMAMMGGVTATTLSTTMFAHPTLAESLNNLFSTPVEPLSDP